MQRRGNRSVPARFRAGDSDAAAGKIARPGTCRERPL